MTITSKLAFSALALAMAGGAGAHQGDRPPADYNCSSCKEWNVPQKPFKLYGNTWYVGTGELSALLITSPRGHILLDGALPQSAALIEQNIKALGFRLKDVKLILNSHAHFDHAGGIAALQRRSGATVVTSAHGGKVLQDGVIGKDDPQYDPAEDPRIEAIGKFRAVADGEKLTLGSLAVTAHMTPGHTPGSTTWSWTSCEDGRCLAMVYADSLTPVSTDGFRYSGSASTPDLSASFRDSIAKVAALKCDVIVSTHPGFTGIKEKLAARSASVNPFIDPEGCRTYAAGALKRLEARLATEKAAVPATPGS